MLNFEDRIELLISEQKFVGVVGAVAFHRDHMDRFDVGLADRRDLPGIPAHIPAAVPEAGDEDTHRTVNASHTWAGLRLDWPAS
jgi:hypothetical protein